MLWNSVVSNLQVFWKNKNGGFVHLYNTTIQDPQASTTTHDDIGLISAALFGTVFSFSAGSFLKWQLEIEPNDGTFDDKSLEAD